MEMVSNNVCSHMASAALCLARRSARTPFGGSFSVPMWGSGDRKALWGNISSIQCDITIQTKWKLLFCKNASILVLLCVSAVGSCTAYPWLWVQSIHHLTESSTLCAVKLDAQFRRHSVWSVEELWKVWRLEIRSVPLFLDIDEEWGFGRVFKGGHRLDSLQGNKKQLHNMVPSRASNGLPCSHIRQSCLVSH